MFLILPRIQRDIVTNVKSHVKYLLFLTDFNKTLIFLADFGNKLKYQIPIFIKICPVGAELSNADRQTDMTKLVVAFRNFAHNGIICTGSIFPT